MTESCGITEKVWSEFNSTASQENDEKYSVEEIDRSSGVVDDYEPMYPERNEGYINVDMLEEFKSDEEFKFNQILRICRERQVTYTQAVRKPSLIYGYLNGWKKCICKEDDCRGRCVSKDETNQKRNMIRLYDLNYERFVLSEQPDNFSEITYWDNMWDGISKRLVGFPSDLYDRMCEVLEQLGISIEGITSKIMSETTLFMGAIGVYLRQLWKSTGLEDIALASYQFVMILANKYKDSINTAMIMKKLYDSAINLRHSWNMNYAEAEEENKRKDSLMDKPDDWRLIYTQLLTSDFVETVRTLLLNLVSYKWFSRDVSKEICKMIGKPQYKMPVIDVVPVMMHSLIKLFKFGEAICRGEPIHDIFFEKGIIDRTIEKAKLLLLSSDKLYTGLPAEGRMCQSEYYNQCTDLIEVIDQFIKDVNPFDARQPILSSLLIKLKDTKTVIDDKLTADSRDPPIGIILHGYPGIGKSKLLQIFPRIYSKLKGWNYEGNLTYTRSRVDEYWEGYMPVSHPFIHYSEVGNESREIALRNGAMTLTELNSLIDGMRFNCNMAFQDKGAVFAQPKLVLIDTNNPSLNAETLVSNPSAIKRRFLYVEAIVKDEFKKQGGESLDVAKSIAAGGELLDRYNFVVRVYNPVDNINSREHRVFEGDVRGLIVYMTQKFRERISMQGQVDDYDPDSLIDNMVALADGEFVDYKSDSEGSVEDLFENDDAWRVPDQPIWDARTESEFEEFGLEDYVEEDLNQKTVQWTSEMLLTSLIIFVSVVRLGAATMKKTLWSYVQGPAMIFILWFGWSNVYVASFVVGNAICNMLPESFDQWLESRTDDIARNKAINKCMYFLGFEDFDPYIAYGGRRHRRIIGALTLAVSAFGLMKVFNRKEKKIVESHFYSGATDVNARVNDLEVVLDAATGKERIKNKLHPSWNVVERDIPPVAFSGDYESMWKVARKNVRTVKVAVGEGWFKTHIYGVAGSKGIVNTHALPEGNFLMRVYNAGYDIEQFTEIFVTRREDMGGDRTMIECSPLRFKDHVKHIVPKALLQSGQAMINDKKVIATFIADKLRFEPNVNVSNVFMYNNFEHRVGMCGIPLTMSVGNNKSCVVGIHGAGSKSSDTGFAISFTREEIESALMKMNAMNPLMNVRSEGCFEIDMELPIQKSMVRYRELHHVKIKGKLPGAVMLNQSSKLYRRELGRIDDFFETHFDFKRTTVYGKPRMKPFVYKGEYLDPAGIAVSKMNKPIIQLNEHTMAHCVQLCVERFSRMLREKGAAEWSPLELMTAVNGDEKDAFLRAVNTNTGSGYGHQGKKSQHIPIVFEDKSKVVREPNDRLKTMVAKIIESYIRGECVEFVIEGCPKDEARDMIKVLIGKTRIFYITPQELLVVHKMFLSSLYTSMVEHSDIYCTAIGYDMHKMSDKLVNDLSEFSEYIIEGDYGGYDVSNPFMIGLGAATLIVDLCHEMGYNETSLKVLQCLLSDGLYPNVALYNDVFCKPGMQPSGKYGTAEDNSLRGLLMLMYAWYTIDDTRDHDFFDNVLPRIYGDDLLAAVKPQFKDVFNNNVYQRFVETHFGMTFTTASKSDEMDDFVDIHTMSFLRRKFVKHACGKYLGRLDLNSLYKTMEWGLKSSSVSQMEQDRSCLKSLAWEVFMHLNDEDDFVSAMCDLKMMFFQKYGVNLETPSYGQIYDTIIGGAEYKDYASDLFVPEDIQCEADFEIFMYGVVEDEKSWQYAYQEAATYHGKIDAMILKWKTARDAIKAEISDEEMEYYETLLTNSVWYSTPKFKKDREVARVVFGALNQCKTTIKTLRRVKLKKTRIMVQAEFEMKDDYTTTFDVETFVDAGGKDTVVKTIGHSSGPDLGQHDIKHIADFLKRPIELANFDWLLNNHVYMIFPIWDLFTKNPTIRAKIRNFAYIRMDLHVRIMMSGTPFHMGKLLVSYQPMSGSNSNLIAHETNYGVNVLWRPLFLNYLSQTKASSVMDPKANTPLDIVCEYIYPKPMMANFNKNSSVLGSADSLDDALKAGELYMMSINPLDAASDSATNVNIQILAYADNVQLGCPTATQMEIVTESEFEDEKKTGPVARVASSVANVMDELTQVPMIEPLARPAGMVARGIEGIASHFGFSKPIIYERPMYVKNRPWENAALTATSSTVEKIALDPQQELTVDPRALATEVDEMAFEDIVSRETYLTTFVWSSTDEILADPIFKCKVSPQLDTYFQGTSTFFQPTPMSFVAQCFRWWHGKIQFRIEVACSAYHRGKLAIFYEPNVYQGAIIDTNLSLNKNFVIVIDLEAQQDKKFRVDWAQSEAFATVERPGYSQFNYGTNFGYTSAAYMSNGYISVVPLTKLQSPNDSPVEVNVYVNGEDLLFGEMFERHLPIARDLVVESEYEPITDRTTVIETLNPTSARSEDLPLYYFGERPTSFRALLKRYSRKSVNNHTAAGDGISIEMHDRIYEEPYPSYFSSTAHERTLFRYLPYAFVGYRGGRRLRLRTVNDAEPGHRTCEQAVVSLGNSSTTFSISDSTNHAYTRMIGSVSFLTATNAGIEVELPYYSPNLFSISFTDELHDPTVEVTGFARSFDYVHEILVKNGIQFTVIQEAAASEDFSFMRFNGAPYYKADI